jgi:ribose transport system substrate-binding protein
MRGTEGHGVFERRRGWRYLTLGALVVAVMALAACGGSDKSDSGGSASSGSNNADASATNASSGGATQAAAAVKAAEAVPAFTPPGPAIDASKAKGKTVLYLSLDNSIPLQQTISKALGTAGKQVGVKVLVCDGKGNPADQNRCMQQAISQKVDVIVIESVSSSLLAAPIKQAAAKGIKVISSTERDEGVPPQGAGIAATTSFKYKEAAVQMAQWAIADSKGKANMLAVQAPDVPNGQDMRTGMEQTFKQECPDCKLSFVQNRVSDWASQMGTLVRTQLTKNHDIDYVLPFYDAMAQFVAPAIRQAGAASRVKVASFNATPAVMQQVKDADIVQADVGSSGDWLGWGEMDQSLRLMVGAKPVQATGVPLRIFDQDNIGSIDLSAPEISWYGGDAFEQGYRKLWGLN